MTETETREAVANALADWVEAKTGAEIQRYKSPPPHPDVPSVIVQADAPFTEYDEDGDTFCDYPTRARYVALILIGVDDETIAYDLLCDVCVNVHSVLADLIADPALGLVVDQTMPPARAADESGQPRNFVVTQINYSTAITPT